MRKKMLDEYKAMGVPPENVFAQSFHEADILYWVKNEPGVCQAGRFSGCRGNR
jgi:glycerophosphoryl diester phosphodiesterase